MKHFYLSFLAAFLFAASGWAQTFPLTQNFDSYDECTGANDIIAAIGADGWTFYASNPTNSRLKITGIADPPYIWILEGTKSFIFSTGNPYTVQILTSPLLPTGGKLLSFKYRSFDISDRLEVGYGETNAEGLAYWFPTEYNTPGSTTSVSNILIPSSAQYVFFRSTGYNQNTVALDDIFIDFACAAPTALATSGTGITWAGTADSYDVVISSTPLAYPATGTVNNTAANSYSYRWTENVTNYVYVRAHCGEDVSAWVNTTCSYGYCTPPTPAHRDYYLNPVTTSGGVSNINYTNSTSNSAGYHNRTDLVVSNYEGTPTSITLIQDLNLTGYFYVWVDWNRDFDFDDANETVAATTHRAASATGTINIPAGTPAGSYRMRVAGSNQGALTACTNSSDGYGDFVDLTFEVLASTCLTMPTELSADALTPTSATISWTAPATAPASYDVYVSQTNTAPTVGTTPTANVAGASYLYNIAANSDRTLYVWVRSNCGGGNVSTWAALPSFTAPTDPCINGAQIGTGTSGSAMIPIGTYQRYSYSQTIYTAADLSAQGVVIGDEISKIAFQYNHTVSTTEWIAVYLGNTAKQSFTSNTDWVLAGSNFPQYSSNSITFTQGWIEIVFTMPFTYTGGNIIVAVDKDTGVGAGGSSNTSYWYNTHSGGSNSTLYYNNMSNNNPIPETVDYTGTLTEYRPNIKFFNCAPTPPTVVTQAATGITQTSAVLNKIVTAGTGTITAQGFKYKQVSETDWENSTDGILSGLIPNTEYEFYAYATTETFDIHGGTLTFSTLHSAPIVITQDATAITQTSATLNKTVTAGTETITEQGFKYKKVSETDWINSTDGILSNLISGTEYEYYAYATTANYPSTNGNTFTFTTLCGAKIIPYSENFNDIIPVDYTSEGNLPSCWNSFTNHADYKAPHVIENGMYSNYMGTAMASNALLFVNNSDGHTSYAVLPELNTAYNLLQISFYVKWENTNCGDFYLGYVTDASDFSTTDATFTSLKQIPTTANTTVVTEELGSYTIPEGAKLVFKFYWNVPIFYGLIIDDIDIDEIPTCPMPTVIAVVGGLATVRAEVGYDYQALLASDIEVEFCGEITEGTEIGNITITADEPSPAPAHSGAQRTPAQTLDVSVSAAVVGSVLTITYSGLADGVTYDVHIPAGAIAEYGSDIDFKIMGKSLIVTDLSGALAGKIVIYPNPATDELFIMNNENLKINSVEIFDISGRAFGAGRALPLHYGGKTINVSTLPAGVYLIKINTDNGVKTERFIKK
ncbi:MAG: T9SS type A sorting domain-containing protein [Prevotellaceae bacterium]|jgi:hypothetical protein|nr:T9SS type A sorting domain-containing protein [Prevotellaceae bacterium]